ncbi:hypothetical protein HQ584_11505 [Patescibacteria group bacterium]|nr:hypothetical protein [Patescibacteria group bacterium]
MKKSDNMSARGGSQPEADQPLAGATISGGKKTNFIILGLIIVFALNLFTVSAVLAEEADLSQDELVASLDEAQALATDELESLDEVEIDEPTAIPGTFSLWWRGIKENISLAITFDPIKKAEKQLLFAEERVKLANFITETSEDPAAQEKAVAIVARANQFMEKVQARSESFLEKTNERTTKLLANVARHELNKEKVLTKLGDKVSLENIPELHKLKDTIAEKTKIFLEKIAENENIPEEVREKITIRKEAITVRQEEQVELREASKELLEKALAGDEEAKVEVEAKREENRTDRKKIIEEFKNKTQGLINKAKESVPDQQTAIRELQQIKTKAINVIKNEAEIIKNRIETQQRIMGGEPASQSGSGQAVQVQNQEQVQSQVQVQEQKQIQNQEQIREPARVETGSGKVEPTQPTTELDVVK